LPGRGITDNSIVLKEIVHFMRRSKKKEGYVTFKLDLEKGYSNSKKNKHIDKMHVILEYHLSSGMRGRL